MNESKFRANVAKKMKGLCRMVSIESPTTLLGIPDKTYSTKQGVRGWIEAKFADSWPRRPSTPLRLPHYTAEQKAFLLLEGEFCGYCWLMVRVDRDIFLFDHYAAQDVGNLCRADMIERAIYYSTVRTFEETYFLKILNTRVR